MKYSIVLVAATLAASVSAQIGNIPQCALTCAFQSIGSTSCAQTDIACVCKASGFISALTPCVEKACTPAEVGQTITAAQGLCAQFGVTLTIPSATTSAAASTSSSSSSSVPVTTEVSTTSTTMMTTTSVTVVVPTTASNMTTTVVATPSSNATTAVPTTALPTASPTGNAASRNSVAVGGAAAILAVFAALL